MSQFDKMLAEGPCEVVFIKRDGTQRIMICSREESAIEAAGGAGMNGSSPKVITVVDLQINEWRCFRPDSVISFRQLETTAD